MGMLSFSKKRTTQSMIYSKELFDSLMGRIEGAWSDKITVSNLVTRMLVQKMNYDEAMNSLGNGNYLDNSRILAIYDNLSRKIKSKCPTIKSDLLVPAGIDEYPLLLNPWNGGRIVQNMIDINDNNVLDGLNEQKCRGNIRNMYLYPMGIVLCSGGNHSQFAALQKHNGRTVIIWAYDFTDMYTTIRFDGKGFYRTDNRKKNYLVECTEDRVAFCAGVLFEIGRINLINGYKKDEWEQICAKKASHSP